MSSVAWITGAAGGIGRVVTTKLAQMGYAVAVHYHQNRPGALTLVQDLQQQGARAIDVQGNVASWTDVARISHRIEDELGPVDVLVNNAGFAAAGLLMDTPIEVWRQVIGVNLDGTFHCCRAVLPGMVRRRRGRIVNIASIWGMVGAADEVPYSAAKAGVIGLTKALAKEVARGGVTVNCVAPGVIQTPMLDPYDANSLAELAEDTPQGRLGQPADVAAVVAFLVSDEASFMTGQVLSPNGGLVV